MNSRVVCEGNMFLLTLLPLEDPTVGGQMMGSLCREGELLLGANGSPGIRGSGLAQGNFALPTCS